MSSTTISSLGQINASGSQLALFLKVFSGEVLSTFEELNVMRPLLTIRTIPYGKSAQFPVLGRASAGYHSAGVNVADSGGAFLSQIPANEKIINVDNKLLSAVQVLEFDELLNHYDIRSLYGQELARVLAKRYDQLAINTVILQARAGAGTLTQVDNHQPKIINANLKTQGVALVNALFLAAQQFDQVDVPSGDRHAIISPAQYYNLIRDPNTQWVSNAGALNGNSGVVGIATGGYPLLDKDVNPTSNGSYAAAQVYQCAGIQLHKSNHIPSTNIANNDPFFGNTAATMAGFNGNTYHGDFTNTAGLVFHKSGAGIVQLKDLAMEQEYKIEFQATLMVAKMVIGMGGLRPESCIELAIA